MRHALIVAPFLLAAAAAAQDVVPDNPLPTLLVGDAAPPLKVSKWVKGGPIDLAAGKGKTIYIVEFWATWCGPCLRTIPHVTAIAERFAKSGVVVVGISIDRPETRPNVEPFVANMGKKMGYAVAIDQDTATQDAYLEAAGVEGIPHAFIVGKDGKIAWHGHPLEGLDVKMAELTGDKEYAEAARKVKELREKLDDAIEEEEWEKATATIDSLIALQPDDPELLLGKYKLLNLRKELEAAKRWGREIVPKLADAEALNQMAWGILTDEDFEGHRDRELALLAARRSNELAGGKSWAILDTYARALAETGSRKEAIDLQRKAVSLAEAGNAGEDELDDLRETLAKYEKGPRAGRGAKAEDEEAAPEIAVAPPSHEAPPVEPGFESLFDGKEIARHWLVKGKPESWKAAGGVIRGGPGGDRLVSRQRYGDFVLRLEYRVPAGGNSGVFLRVPSQDDAAPQETGLEVLISNAATLDDAHCTGALSGVEAVKPRPDESPEVWHAAEIACVGKRVAVKIDGVRCTTADAEKNPELAKRPAEGFIGLRDSSSEDPKSWIEYRDIRIERVAPDGTIPGFALLSADGKGWHTTKTGHGTGGRWTFAGGAWSGEQDPPGSGNGGINVTDATFGDFEFVLEVKPAWGSDSGIFLRSTDDGKAYQVLVDYIEGSSIGGIYGEGLGGFAQTGFTFLPDATIALKEGGAIAPADWKKWWDADGFNEIRGRIVGNPPSIDVWLNGKHVTFFHDETRRLGDRGRFGLQVHGGAGRWPKDKAILYRGIQVREIGK